MKDYYDILGLTDNERKLQGKDFEKVLKKRYRRCAIENHPDKNPGNKEAEEKFKEVAEAYRILSDKDLRQRYDTFGTVDDTFGGSSVNPEDIFREFFRNSGFNPFASDFEDSDYQKQVNGTDKVLHIKVTLSEIFNGANKTIKYTVNRPCKECGGSGSADGKSSTCPHCHGTGQMHIRQTHAYGFMEQIVTCPHCHGTGTSVENMCKKCHGTGLQPVEETLEIKVPTIDKVLTQVYGKAGYGNSAPNNLGGNGDLRFTFRINENNAAFSIDRENALNIVTEINIPIIKCLLGCSVTITHLDGKEYSLTVPECTKDNTILRISKQGFRHSNGMVGDLLVKVNMILPNSLGKEEKKILKKLQETKTFK